MNITSALLAEHGVFYAQFEYLERVVPSAPLSEVKSLAAMLESALEVHADLEDNVLFPPIEAHLQAENGPTAPFREEHDEIRQTLSRVPGARDVEAAREALLRAVELARDHFAKEEQALFPLADETLTAEEQEELGRVWAERRRVRIA